MPELKPEQREAIFHDAGNILVSASAGSGKTFVMIERAIRLICEGKAKVKEILAATFTEAAAEEMRERLKKALTEKIAEGKTELAEELADVYTADVCTLHSFCGRLIRTYFFVAGVAPDFKIIDGDDSRELKTEAMEQTFREFYAGKEKWFLTVCDRYKKKRSDKAFKELIAEIFDYCDTEKDPERLFRATLDAYSDEGYDNVKSEYERYLLKALKPLKADLERAVSGFKETQLKQGEEFAKRVYDDLCAVESGGIYKVKEFADYLPPYSFPRKLDEKNQEYKALAVGARNALKTLFNRIIPNLGDENSDRAALAELKTHTEGIFKITRRFAELYGEKKAAENALDFSDLEHYALKVLSDEQVLSEVRNRYKYIFVDEYQDVNGVQEEIISRIARDNAFMVGDVKQSIYGFRGCRPEIFAEKLSKMRDRGEKTVLLNFNFRSSDAVIDAVNGIFDYSMTEAYFGENYAGNAELKAGGVYEGGGEGRAELHLLKTESEPREKETPRIYDILEEIKKEKTVKADISALVANLIRGELEKKYYDPKSKTFKRVTYSDVVILTRTRNSGYVRQLVSGLVRRGIPVASEVEQNVCDFPEVAVLINALKLTECFIDDIALVSVLKSKLGGFSEEDLAGVALFYAENANDAKGGFYDAFVYYLAHADGELHERLTSFRDYFLRVRFLSDYLGAGGTLNKLVRDSFYEEYLLSEPNGAIKVKRVKRFLSIAEGNGKPLTVTEFLRKADNGGDAFAVSECGGEDNVRIMTIHASKGLEFPVVIVCGLERKSNKREETGDVLSDRTLGFAARLYDDEKRTYRETPLRGLIKEKMRENRMKEELRLFYVATTRAAYSLHLTFEGKEDKRKAVFTGAESFLDYVPSHMPVTVWERDSFGAAEMTLSPRRILIGKPDERLTKLMRNNFDYVYPFSSDCALPLKTAVTALLHAERADGYDKTDEPIINTPDNIVKRLDERVDFIDENVNPPETTERKSRRNDATDEERGVIAHKILQHFDFARADEFDIQLSEMLSRGVVSESELSQINAERIKKAVKSEVFTRLNGYELYREKSFIAQAGAKELFGADTNESVVIQGVIDLLAVKDDCIAVVDYKYSRAGAARLKARYKKQLDVYASTAARVLGKKIEFKTLVNLYSGEVIEIT